MKPLLMLLMLTAGYASPARGDTAPDPSRVYRNPDFGLAFRLPESWQGYSVIYQQWDGLRFDQAQDKDVEAGKGPVIVLRHPEWTAEHPRQDIAILVFTLEQWAAGMQTNIKGQVPDTAPFELSRNSKYVLAFFNNFNAEHPLPGTLEAAENLQRNGPAVLYHNSGDGLTFFLPPNWRGYSVVYQRWDSKRYDQARDEDVDAGHGPIIVLRHPGWTPAHPYQNLPIRVFTLKQWADDVQDGIDAGGCEFEIARNSRFVFAYNSRFNANDSVPGSAEAGEILQQNISELAMQDNP